MRNIKFLLLIFFFCSNAYAEGYLCPKTYRYIDLGSSLPEVEQACGKPISTSTEQQAKTVTEPTEQWVYYGSEKGEQDHPAEWRSKLVSRPSDFDIYLPRLPKLYITFRRNKVASVTLESQEVGSSTMCGNGYTVKKGDDRDAVVYGCGSPLFVNHGYQTFYEGLVDTTTWIYQFDAYQPRVILQFQNNKLTRINTR